MHTIGWLLVFFVITLIFIYFLINVKNHLKKTFYTVYLSDTRVFLTVAVDLVIVGIQEPVRFLIETKAKIFPTNERFWYFSKKPHYDQFILKLKEVRVSEAFQYILWCHLHVIAISYVHGTGSMLVYCAALLMGFHICFFTLHCGRFWGM